MITHQSTEHDETIVPFSHEVLHVKEERLPYSAKGEERRPVADAKRNQKIPVQGGSNALNQPWVDAYQGLVNEIKLRHYSPKTLKSYRGWVRKFQTCLTAWKKNTKMQVKILYGNGFFQPRS